KTSDKNYKNDRFPKDSRNFNFDKIPKFDHCFDKFGENIVRGSPGIDQLDVWIEWVCSFREHRINSFIIDSDFSEILKEKFFILQSDGHSSEMEHTSYLTKTIEFRIGL